MIEKRLQMKLRKETDSVRRAEEAKKEKSLANRKEEELQLKDSIVSSRYQISWMPCAHLNYSSNYGESVSLSLPISSVHRTKLRRL